MAASIRFASAVPTPVPSESNTGEVAPSGVVHPAIGITAKQSIAAASDRQARLQSRFSEIRRLE
jgi:hypothetical protein